MSATPAIPKQLLGLKKIFRQEFGASRVEFEKLPGMRQYRIAVVSPQFEKMPHLKRQDKLWKRINELLKPDDTLKISLVLAFAPSELRDAPKSTKLSA